MEKLSKRCSVPKRISIPPWNTKIHIATKVLEFNHQALILCGIPNIVDERRIGIVDNLLKLHHFASPVVLCPRPRNTIVTPYGTSSSNQNITNQASLEYTLFLSLSVLYAELLFYLTIQSRKATHLQLEYIPQVVLVHK